jgi:thiosulfate dehydrogenase
MTAHKTCRTILLAAVLAFPMALPAAAQAPAPASAAWDVPDIDALPDNAQSRLIQAGSDLIRKTYEIIGPLVDDPAKRYAGNNLACKSCHLDDGTKKFGLPLWGLTRVYPQHDARTGRVLDLTERVNQCMTRSMNGRPLPGDAPEMKAMLAYLDFLSTGLQPGQKLDGYGAGAMPELQRAADPGRGLGIYQEHCLRCHGTNGEGVRRSFTPTDLGYVTPPLWGPDAFNEGAGMKQLITAANFTHSNMPNGVSYDFPRLSVEDSWDVAAYIVAQPHPRLAGIEKDYPDLLEKPVDAPYGPYADGFSQEQHVFGPFGPIRDALARLRDAKGK